MEVLSATGERSFPRGLRVRCRTGWSGEEKDGAEGQGRKNLNYEKSNTPSAQQQHTAHH